MRSNSMAEQESSGILLPDLGITNMLYPTVKLGKVYKKKDGSWHYSLNMKMGHNEDVTLRSLLDTTIENGVSQIAIDASNRLYAGIHKLDPEFKTRWLKAIKEDQTTMPELRTLWRPIEEEFEVEIYDFGDNAVGVLGDSNGLEALHPGLVGSLHALKRNLYFFLLGKKYNLQINISLNETKNALKHVRKIARNERTRENMSAILGILNSYVPCSLESLQFRPTATDKYVMKVRELIEDRLLDDKTYRTFTVLGYKLGIPRHISRTIVEIGRQSKKLLSHPVFGLIYGPATKVIQVAANTQGADVPLPSSEALTALVRKEYLPPIVPIKVELMSLDEWIQSEIEQQARQQRLPAVVIEALRNRFALKKEDDSTKQK